MKFYRFDCGYRGSLICVAKSLEDAIKIFDIHKDSYIHTHGSYSGKIDEFPIEEGIFIECYGDC